MSVWKEVGTEIAPPVAKPLGGLVGQNSGYSVQFLFELSWIKIIGFGLL